MLKRPIANTEYSAFNHGDDWSSSRPPTSCKTLFSEHVACTLCASVRGELSALHVPAPASSQKQKLRGRNRSCNLKCRSSSIIPQLAEGLSWFALSPPARPASSDPSPSPQSLSRRACCAGKQSLGTPWKLNYGLMEYSEPECGGSTLSEDPGDVISRQWLCASPRIWKRLSTFSWGFHGSKPSNSLGKLSGMVSESTCRLFCSGDRLPELSARWKGSHGSR